VLGGAGRFSRRQYLRARNESALAPKLLAPMLCLTTVIVPSGDFDNNLWFLLKFVLPYAAVVLVASTRTGHTETTGFAARFRASTATGSATGLAKPGRHRSTS